MIMRFFRYSMAHGKKAWFLNHVKDEHVRKAQAQGFRSRASFKLLQIEDKFSIIGEALTALDLGSAPGSWSQAIKSISPKTKVAAVDLLPMKELEGVDFYNTDARSPLLHQLLLQQYGKFDVIVSDMAPNFSGTLFQTHQEIVQLNKCCLDLSLSQGSPNSSLIMKTVDGNFQKSLGWTLQYFYTNVTRFKPKSSRAQSAQHYIICQQRRKIKDLEKVVGKLKTTFIQEIRRKSDLSHLLTDQEA